MSLSDVYRNLDAFERRLHQRGRSAVQALGPYLVEWTKAEKPWQDRTGETAASIQAFLSEAAEGVQVSLTATVDHARFLELARGGKWAFLLPVIERHEADIRRILSEEMRR